MGAGIVPVSPLSLRSMAFLPKPVSPRAAWRDATGFLRETRRHQLVIAALAIVCPALIIYALIDEFTVERVYEPPTIVYVEQWSAARSRAESAARIARDAPAERAEKAAQAAREAERREQFKRAAKTMKAFGL